LEVSTLTDLPGGRAGVTTHVVPADNAAWVARAWQRVREEVDAGRRAYVVCPRISADDADADAGADDADLLAEDEGLLFGAAAPRRPLRAVLEVAEELARTPALAGVGIGVLHGRLPAA